MFSYVILGAGKQGRAAAYDVLKFGQAKRLTLVDKLEWAQQTERNLRKLLGPWIIKNKIELKAVSVDARDQVALARVLKGHHAALSSLPYYLNPVVAEAAIAAGVHYCDLGGYFETTQEIMKLDGRAERAGVTMVTDCGVAPGMCNSLAVCGMDQLNKPQDVHIYCGGLPQHPRPPLDYKIVFNLEGVLGNYFGKAYVLQNGKVKLIPTFGDKEIVDMGRPLGKLEAIITGGATSTCPWTFQGKLRNYDYKTLRYLGHYDKIQMLKDLGLFETDPVRVNGYRLPPREMFVASVGSRLAFPKDKDLLVMRVAVRGLRDGQRAEVVYDVLDYQDPRTGFTAMQRTTGFSAAIVLEMLAQGRISARGFVPVEKAISGRVFLDEIRRRGVQVKERIRVSR